MTNKINMVINLSILALLIYLAISVKKIEDKVKRVCQGARASMEQAGVGSGEAAQGAVGPVDLELLRA